MQSPLNDIRRVAAVFFMCAVAAVRAASADTVSLAWDPSADSTVTGYVVYVGTQSNVYSQTFDVGNVTTFSYSNAVAGQRYYFTVAAYIPGPKFSSKSSEVSTFTNRAPVVTNPGNQTTSVGKSVALQISASDPDGTPITYSASGLPAGLQLTTGTGLIAGAPTTAGTSTVTVTASDGVLRTTVTFTWTISGQTPTAPVPVSPAGTITTSTPKFTWNAGNTATSYLLVVDDSKTAGRIRTTVTASAAGCATTTVCSFSPNVALAPGSARWTVETMTSTGAGPWSVAMAFAVPDSVKPAVGIVAPSGAGSTWETKHSVIQMSGTASDNGAVASVSWSNSRGGSGTATGTTSWSANVAAKAGINVITITARDSAGNSTSTTLTVVQVPPPTLISPASGGSASLTPTFSWSAVPSASKYVLKVTTSTGVVKVLTSVTPFQAGCETTTTCSFKPSVVLAAGTTYWTVETIAMTDLGAWAPVRQFLAVK